MPVYMKALLLLSSLLLSACGYHLRGSNYDPATQINSVFLLSEGAGSIDVELRRQMDYNDIQVAQKANDAEAVITVYNERSDERVLSVDPRTGKAREYELGYHVSFKIDGADGKPFTSPQNIDLSRDFTFDEAAALSKFEEAKVVREEMKRDAVDSILRRLASVHSKAKH